MRREFVFAAGTNITSITLADNADGTQTVTINASGGAAFDADIPNPTIAAGAATDLPAHPAGWVEIAPGTGKWIPYWTAGT